MSRDSIKIIINDIEINSFATFSFSNSMFEASENFSFEFTSGLVSISEGDRISVFVNDVKELVGLIDSVALSGSKPGNTTTISGRDVLGMAVDSFIEDFETKNNISLIALAKAYIKNVYFLNRSNIIVSEDSENLATDQEIFKAEIGDSVFEILLRLATTRRMLFYAKANGDLTFAKVPTEKIDDFFINRNRNDPQNNTIQADFTEDFSKVYSEVWLFGQTEEGNNYKKTYTNDLAPFRKIFIGSFNEDEGSIEEQARSIAEDQNRQSFDLSYSVSGLSQNGKNWSIRKGVFVKDSFFDLDDIYLISSRTFTGSKTDFQTNLKLIKYASR